MSYQHHNQVKAFLDQICRPVKAKELHNEIKLEIESHVNDIIEEHLRNGRSEEDAVNEAVEQMGDPIIIGKQFRRIHKPRFEWGLISSILLFIAIAILAMYNVQLALSERFQTMFLANKMIFAGIGMCVMIIFIFFDYRKLKIYSWSLFFLTLLAILYSFNFGVLINGSRRWLDLGFLMVDVLNVSPYFLMLAVAGIAVKWKQERVAPIKEYLVVLGMPSLLYMAGHSIIPFILYITVVMVFLWLTTLGWRQLLLRLAPLIMLFVIHIIVDPSRVRRIIYFMNPQQDPHANYMMLQSIEAIRSAGWWGQGMGVKNDFLANIHSEMIFTYFIYSFGWVTGFFLIAAVVFFLLRLLLVAVNIKEDYGRFIVCGILSLFFIQFIWSMFMSIGLLPIAGISFPFISYGGSQFILQLAVIGIILSIYRRKDMIKFNTFERI